MQLGLYLQELLQRKNNEVEGASLCEIPTGSSLLLFADASALNSDTFSGFGVTTNERKRQFSDLLASMTHDERQYTPSTLGAQKKSKYDKNVTRLAPRTA